MSEIYLIGDCHFSHNKGFIYESRGFETIEEHDQKLIENWNNVVKSEDIVYLLGDVCMGSDLELAEKYIRQLNGHIQLAYGNHDSSNKIQLYRQYFDEVQLGYKIKYKKYEYWLSHYPMIVDNGNDLKPVFNIHAHCHYTHKFSAYPKCYSVSADSINNTPINIEQVHQEIKEHVRWLQQHPSDFRVYVDTSNELYR